jgi:hypothetical protein
LAETLANTAIASQLNAFAAIGLTGDALMKLRAALPKPVTLSFRSTETCTFVKEEVKYIDSATKHVVESSMFGTFSSKTTTKITEYVWDFRVQYEAFFYAGSDPKNRIATLFQRNAQCDIRTGGNINPRTETRVCDPIELNFSWFLQNLTADKLQTKFFIDRSSSICRTPRRNPQIEEALYYLRTLSSFASKVGDYFRTQLFPLDNSHKFDLSSINASRYFVPVLPLFVEGGELVELKQIDLNKQQGALVLFDSAAEQHSEVILKMVEINSFLNEQINTLVQKKEELAKIFNGGTKLVTPMEANIMSVSLHMTEISRTFVLSVNYIEDMLRQQLTSAIGKVIGPVEFAKYMTFHNRKLLKQGMDPRSFSYAIRRPQHFPEGVLSVDIQYQGDSLPESINTIVRVLEPEYPMQFAINAATNVSFFGERYIHAWMSYGFSGQEGFQASVNARARQFSSFILLLGNIASNTVFLPKFAMIIQNKDDLKIPLELEKIPTAKEFRDAIQSLSPEQQRFAKAYRSMQLESTMFGICVLQIKPQLEKLLKLPFDSLTKEIKLTQDLMELFIKYQIPSDLLSYAGEDDVPPSSKVQYVKNQVNLMYEMLNASKDKELEEKRQEAEYTLAAEGYSVESPRADSKPGVWTSTGSSPKIKHSAHFQNMSRVHSAKMPVSPPIERKLPSSKPRAEAQASSPTRTQSPLEQKGSSEVSENEVEFTTIPVKLDSRLGNLPDAVRPIIIKPGQVWTKRSQKNLLAPFVDEQLGADKQDIEKDKCFDLLDALSRSGSLPFDEASLHILMGMSHSFNDTLINTLVKENRNPIESVEQTTLLVASTIQDKPIAELINADQVDRIQQVLPHLLQ